MARPNFVLITADDMNWDAGGSVWVSDRGNNAQYRPLGPPRDCDLSTVMWTIAVCPTEPLGIDDWALYHI